MSDNVYQLGSYISKALNNLSKKQMQNLLSQSVVLELKALT